MTEALPLLNHISFLTTTLPEKLVGKPWTPPTPASTPLAKA